MVKLQPVRGRREGILDAVRLVAARQELHVHGIRVSQSRRGPSVEMSLEMDDTLSLEVATKRPPDSNRPCGRRLPPWSGSSPGWSR